jgi:membrane protein insertase Oxa1/YidC/SpoIIIJ
MFYIMMAIIPIICYSMPSALTLYWTMQNILTIFQTWLVRRSRDKDSGTAGKVDIIPPTKKKGRGKGQPFAR